MKTLIVVQARTGSSRLPGKVLLPLAGRPMLARQLERIRAATTPFEVVVATTVGPEDDPIRELCRELGEACYSGDPLDLLDRHYQAAREHAAELVVKVPSDCPLIDPAVIDRTLAAFLAAEGRYDYVSNLHPATYPDGNDVEVLSFEALDSAWREARRPHEREHTTPFVWDQPERFRIGNVTWETGLDLSMTHRFTVDYPEDYVFVAAVYGALWSAAAPIFGLAEIFDLLSARPGLVSLNRRHLGVNWYRHHLPELRTITPRETRLELAS